MLQGYRNVLVISGEKEGDSCYKQSFIEPLGRVQRGPQLMEGQQVVPVILPSLYSRPGAWSSYTNQA